MTVYDVHAHCVPPGLLDEVARATARYATEVVETEDGPALRFAGGVTTKPVRPELSDIDHRLATMDAGRIDVQLVSPWIHLAAYTLPSPAGIAYARMLNETLADAVASRPDRLLGLCTVPLQAPLAAAVELRHAVAELGMVGVEIATTVNGRELDDPTLDPFWAEAAELRCPVLLHPHAPLTGRGVSRHHLGNLVGNPAETTIAVAHVVFGGVMERHSALRLIVAHGGGFAPWQAGRWDRGFRHAAHRAAGHLTRPPSAWLRQMYFDTVLHDPVMVGHLVDWAGSGHVVLGTDYPFPMGDHAPFDTLEAVPGLAADAREAISSRNVEALLAEVAHR